MVMLWLESHAGGGVEDSVFLDEEHTVTEHFAGSGVDCGQVLEGRLLRVVVELAEFVHFDDVLCVDLHVLEREGNGLQRQRIGSKVLGIGIEVSRSERHSGCSVSIYNRGLGQCDSL